MLLARAGDRIEYRAAAHYIRSAGDAIRHRRMPEAVRLTEDAVRLALEAPLSWVTEDWHRVERPWESLPPEELLTLLWHLGDQYGRPYGTLYLGSGPIVAVIVSILALIVHALL